MTRYYSPSNNAFYDDAIHGARQLTIVDPAWTWPLVKIVDPAWVRPTIEVPAPDWMGDGAAPMVKVPDPDAAPAMIDTPDYTAEPTTITIDNPDCKLPADAAPITDDEHAALFAAQAAGKVIAADGNGKPVASDPPPPTLERVKARRSQAIRDAYEAACLDPVPALGVAWNGGFDSAIKLDAAMRLAQAAGTTDVTFFDVDNVGHPLAFQDALKVVVTVAADYQTKLARKQACMAAIASATTVEDVLAVAI